MNLEEIVRTGTNEARIVPKLDSRSPNDKGAQIHLEGVNRAKLMSRTFLGTSRGQRCFLESKPEPCGPLRRPIACSILARSDWRLRDKVASCGRLGRSCVLAAVQVVARLTCELALSSDFFFSKAASVRKTGLSSGWSLVVPQV